MLEILWLEPAKTRHTVFICKLNKLIELGLFTSFLKVGPWMKTGIMHELPVF